MWIFVHLKSVKYACECVKMLSLSMSCNSHIVLEINPLKIALRKNYRSCACLNFVIGFGACPCYYYILLLFFLSICLTFSSPSFLTIFFACYFLLIFWYHFMLCFANHFISCFIHIEHLHSLSIGFIPSFSFR